MTAARFHWDIRNNKLHWSDNARDVLGLSENADISSIGALMLYVDATHSDLRHEAVFDPANAERREYSICYRFLPEGRNGERGFMVVERGRWLPNAKGEPAHVFGEILRADCVDSGLCSVPLMPDQVDPSSGLHCRSYFMKRLEAFLRHGTGNNRNAALIILTLKNYPIIFDAYGFKAADAAFVEVGKRLKNVMRAGDILARYGDKRLAMLIHDCEEEDLQAAMARFLEAPCREPVQTELGPVWPMLALGTTIIPRDAKTLSEAIAYAEEALAEAEQQPGNTGMLYNIATSKASHRAMKAHFANEVFAALNEKAFTLAYQPIIGARDGGIYYHEALLHVFDKDGEIVSAGHLIPVAEELGLIRLVDLEVLDLALEALREQPEGRLGINVSATTVMDSGAFLEKLTSHAELVRDRFVVEITESSMLHHAERVVDFIDALHRLGCKVALDDFGAGYTSFRNMRDFRFDIVKLDGAFCVDLATNEQNQHFMRSLIELARKTNMDIIAEWVEREEDAELLREWGVDGLQGFLFGAAELQDAPWPVLCKKQIVAEKPVLPVKGESVENVLPNSAAFADSPEKGFFGASDAGAAAEDGSMPVAGRNVEPEAEANLEPELETRPEAGAEPGVESEEQRGEEVAAEAHVVSRTESGTESAREEAIGESSGLPVETSAGEEIPTVSSPVSELMRELEGELAALREALMKMRESASLRKDGMGGEGIVAGPGGEQAAKAEASSVN